MWDQGRSGCRGGTHSEGSPAATEPSLPPSPAPLNSLPPPVDGRGTAAGATQRLPARSLLTAQLPANLDCKWREAGELSAAAAGAVQALQQPGGGSAHCVALAEVIPAATFCSITLQCTASTCTRLCSGNLLASSGRGPALLAGPSLFAAATKERKSKLLKDVGEHRGHSMEDVAAVVAETGCTAIVCLPLAGPDGKAGSCSAEGAPCLGALTVGFPTAAHITSASLKGALLLAHALSKEQGESLQYLSDLVTSLLLTPAQQTGRGREEGEGDGRASDSDASWGHEEEEEDGEEAEEEQHAGSGGPGSSDGRPPGGDGEVLRRGGRASGSGTAGAGPRSFSRALLAFPSRQQEREFGAYHAQHMQRVDACAYLLCLLFYCMEAFLPGTPFFLVKRMGWRLIGGWVGMLPGTLLLTNQGRKWFAGHRDLLLAFTWVAVTCWMTRQAAGLEAASSAAAPSVSNYLHILEPASFRHPLYHQSFGWVTVVGLAFQMRFRYQAVAAPLAYAVNTRLLPAICAHVFAEQCPRRCFTLGMLRAFLHGVLLPLACCYVFETNARRLFTRVGAAGWHGAWAAPQRARRAHAGHSA